MEDVKVQLSDKEFREYLEKEWSGTYAYLLEEMGNDDPSDKEVHEFFAKEYPETYKACVTSIHQQNQLDKAQEDAKDLQEFEKAVRDYYEREHGYVQGENGVEEKVENGDSVEKPSENHGDKSQDVTEKPEELKPDMVNHPPHYTSKGTETIDMMEIYFGTVATIHYCLLNNFKYRERAGLKDNLEQDIEKAEFYKNKYLELVDKLGTEHEVFPPNVLISELTQI